MQQDQRFQMRRADDRIHERLATIEERVCNLCDQLLDNGQPGELTKLRTKIDTVDAKITELQSWRRWVHGIALAATSIAAALAWAWDHLIHGAKTP
jgi:hypothetical protein